jgi:hypothetical protein
MKNIEHKNIHLIHRKKIPTTIRTTIVGLLLILLLASATAVFISYQTPEIKTIETPLLHYEQNGRFDYIVSLKNNTVYHNQTTLYPGEAILFNQLLNHINASFSYNFRINQTAEITGNYSIDAILQTNLWNTSYPLVPTTPFREYGTTINTAILFPINYTFYDTLLKKINNETGIQAQNPLLIIQSHIMLSATNENGTVINSFNPSISISLNQKIIDITKNLTSHQSGILTKNTNITQQNILQQRFEWSILSLVFLISIPLILLFTKNTTNMENKAHNELKKIKKKYGEWIVETNTYPESTNVKRIQISSLDDLVKISEIVGKPILMYVSTVVFYNRFYVVDENTMYEYIFKPQETNLKKQNNIHFNHSDDNI